MSSLRYLKSPTFLIVHGDSCPTSSVGPSVSEGNREELRSSTPSHLHLQLSCHIRRNVLSAAAKVEFAVDKQTLANDLLLTSSSNHPSTPLILIPNNPAPGVISGNLGASLKDNILRPGDESLHFACLTSVIPRNDRVKQSFVET